MVDSEENFVSETVIGTHFDLWQKNNTEQKVTLKLV